MKLLILLLALFSTSVLAHPELHIHDHDGDKTESTLIEK